VVDAGLARRLKALACTAPLHDLDARKTKLDWVDASVYQMAEIALHTIDQVTVAMDFDTGADHGRIVRRLRPFIAAQAPGRDTAEHDRIARWVLDNLINVGSTDRGFRSVYGAVGADGQYQRRAFDFKLLIELTAPNGDIYLRTSDEAINVLVGALDTDVESAQIAAEVKLDNLIRRGRLADAKLAAEQARYRTVQYGTSVTYGELADRHGGGIPARAVGGIMGSNPLPLVVPCHRVVAHDGLGGYSGGTGDGLEIKRRLLALEGVLPPTLY
jgi:O-6-methylguanine DNA methyltransferase